MHLPIVFLLFPPPLFLLPLSLLFTFFAPIFPLVRMLTAIVSVDKVKSRLRLRSGRFLICGRRKIDMDEEGIPAFIPNPILFPSRPLKFMKKQNRRTYSLNSVHGISTSRVSDWLG